MDMLDELEIKVLLATFFQSLLKFDCGSLTMW